MSSPTVIYETLRTVPITKFLPELRFEFIDLPEQLFVWAILRAARDAASDGGFLRRRAVIHAQRGVTRYLLRSPDGMEINSILGIRCADCCGTHDVRRSFDPPASSCRCTREIAWFDLMDNVLHVNSNCCDRDYFVSFTVIPPDDACELPEEFYKDYIDILLAGAKARILRLNNKPWTNFQLSDAYEKDFRSAILGAAIERHTNKMRGGVKMNFGKAL